MIFACKNRREYLALALLTFTFVTVPFNKSSWDWLASLGNFLLLLLCFVYKHVFISRTATIPTNVVSFVFALLQALSCPFAGDNFVLKTILYVPFIVGRPPSLGHA